MAKKKSAKVQQRWEQASAELQRAVESKPDDTRFALDIVEEDLKLPTYEQLAPEEKRGSRWLVETAPSSNPKRPRANTVAYNSDDRALIIIFSSGACCRYENISSDLWLSLKSSKSTNDFVTDVLSGHPYTYCDVSELSEEAQARINYTTEKSARIQKGTAFL